MTMNREIGFEHVTPALRLNAQAPIHELLANRRSPRAFSDHPVEPVKLKSIFEAARWSPSSANEQPWRYILATKDDQIFLSLFASLSENNRRWAQHVPVLVLALAESIYARTGRSNRHAWYDLGQSVASLSVQATALGVSVHQMGGFDAQQLVNTLSIPEGFDPVTMIAIGYADHPESLPEDLQKREEAPRARRSLDELVFTEAWGQPSAHLTLEHSLHKQQYPN